MSQRGQVRERERENMERERVYFVCVAMHMKRKLEARITENKDRLAMEKKTYERNKESN